jgi:hypothetical protein
MDATSSCTTRPYSGWRRQTRLVLSVDLADYKDREDFEARIYPELELIAKKELEAGGGLERRVAQEAVRELLTSNESKTWRRSGKSSTRRRRSS